MENLKIVHVVFKPAIKINTRIKYEDHIEELLDTEIISAGTDLNEDSSSFISIETNLQVDKVEEILRKGLVNSRVPKGTFIEIDSKEKPVYTEKFPYKPWWRFW